MSEDCSCILPDFDDEDGPKVFQERLLKARKTHKCVECGEAISKGEQHAVASGLWGTRWEQYRTCLGCRDIWKSLCCGSGAFGYLCESLEGSGIIGSSRPLQACVLRELNVLGAQKLKELWLKNI